MHAHRQLRVTADNGDSFAVLAASPDRNTAWNDAITALRDAGIGVDHAECGYSRVIDPDRPIAGGPTSLPVIDRPAVITNQRCLPGIVHA